MLQTAVAPPAPAQPRRGELTPSLEQIRHLVDQGDGTATTVAIYRETLADLETPVSAYLKIRGTGPAFLLESIEGGERLARYSFIGARPLSVLRLEQGIATAERPDGSARAPYRDPLIPLGEMLAPYQELKVPGMALPRFIGGAVGYLSATRRCATSSAGAEPRPAGLGLPDGMFMLVDTLLVFDHLRAEDKVVAHVAPMTGDGWTATTRGRRRRIDALVELLRAPTPTPPRGTAVADTSVESRRGPNMTRDYYGTMIERAQGVHRRRRHLPGRALAAGRRADAGAIRSRSTARCGRSTRRRTCSISISAITRSSAPRRRLLVRLEGDAAVQPSDRRHPAARRDAGGGRAHWPGSCSPTRRSAPSTSCWSISAATTSAGSRSRAPSACRS